MPELITLILAKSLNFICDTLIEICRHLMKIELSFWALSDLLVWLRVSRLFQVLCEDSELCYYYSYSKEDRYCLLFTSCPSLTLTPCPSCVTGQPGCTLGEEEPTTTPIVETTTEAGIKITLISKNQEYAKIRSHQKIILVNNSKIPIQVHTS